MQKRSIKGKNDVKICLNSGCRSFKLFSMYDFFSSSPSLFLIYFSSFRHTLQPGNVPRPVPVRQNSIHQASTVSYSQVFFIKKTVNFMKFSHKLSWDYWPWIFISRGLNSWAPTYLLDLAEAPLFCFLPICFIWWFRSVSSFFFEY